MDTRTVRRMEPVPCGEEWLTEYERLWNIHVRAAKKQATRKQETE